MDACSTTLLVIGFLSLAGEGLSAGRRRRDVVGCETGWWHLSQACYFFSLTPQTFHQAESVCKTHGASLASIHSEKELVPLANRTAVDFELETIWIGGTYSKGQIQWIDNTTNNYNPGNIVASSRGKLCVSMGHDKKGTPRWEMMNCSTSRPYLCKKPSDSQCREEDITWLNVRGRSFPKHNVKKIDDVDNMGKCKRICLKQSEFSCLSVNYLRAKKFCILSSDSMRSNAEVDLIRSRHFTYAEWSCGAQKDQAMAIASVRIGTRETSEPPPPSESPSPLKRKKSVCPQGYFIMAGECIKASFKAMTFDDAKEFCFKHSGRISHILRKQGIPDLETMYKDLDRRLRKSSLTEGAYWLGATWTKGTNLRWVDPNSEIPPLWATEQPNAKGQCVVYTEKGAWATRDCDSKYSFVCRRDASTDSPNIEYFTLQDLLAQIGNITNRRLSACRRDASPRRKHRFVFDEAEGYIQAYRRRTAQCKSLNAKYKENGILRASIELRLWAHRNDSEPIPIITGAHQQKFRRKRQTWKLLKPDVYYRHTGLPMGCHNVINKTLIHELGSRNTKNLMYIWYKTFTARTFTQLRCVEERTLRKIFLSANELTAEELKNLPSTVYRIFSPLFFRNLDKERKWAYCAGLLQSNPSSHDVKFALEDKNCRNFIMYSNMSRYLPAAVTSSGYIMSLFCNADWRESNGASCRLHTLDDYEFCFKIGGIRYYDLRPKCLPKHYANVLMNKIINSITARGRHDRLQVSAALLLMAHGFVDRSTIFCLILDTINDEGVRRKLLQLPQAKYWIFECYIPTNFEGGCGSIAYGFDDPKVQRVALAGLDVVEMAESNRTTRAILNLCSRMECPDDVVEKLDPSLVFYNMDACRPAGCWSDPTVGAKVAGILRMVREYMKGRVLTFTDLLRLKCVLPGLGRNFLFQSDRETVLSFARNALPQTPLDKRTAHQLARIILPKAQQRLMAKKPSQNALSQIYGYFKPLVRLLPYVEPDLVQQMDPEICAKFLPDIAECNDKCDSVRPQWFLAWKRRAMDRRGWTLQECHTIIQSCNGGRFLSPDDIYECAQAHPSSIYNIENKRYLNRHMCYAALNVQSERWHVPLEEWPTREIRLRLGRLIIGLHPDNITRILSAAKRRDEEREKAEEAELEAWKDNNHAKKDLRRTLKARKESRKRRLAAALKPKDDTKYEMESILDYILLFATYFPQLRSSQRYAVMEAMVEIARYLPDEIEDDAFRKIRKIVLNDDTGNLVKTFLWTSRDRQKTMKRICEGVKIPYVDRSFLHDIVELYKEAEGTTMLDEDDIVALDQCGFGLTRDDLKAVTNEGIQEMCFSGIHYFDWDEESMNLLAKRTYAAFNIKKVADLDMNTFRSCPSLMSITSGDEIKSITNLKVRCEAFPFIKRGYWIRRLAVSTRIERGEVRMSVTAGNAMYRFKRWEPVRKMWNFIQDGWSAATNACSRLKDEINRKKRRHGTTRKRRLRRAGPPFNASEVSPPEPLTCFDLRLLGDAVVEQDIKVFANLSRSEFMDCLYFIGSRNGYPDRTKKYLAQLAKKHAGDPADWDPDFIYDMGCIAQGLDATDLTQLSYNVSSTLESMGEMDGWSEPQLIVVLKSYLQDQEKSYSGLNGGDLMRMKNFVCGIHPDDILPIRENAYREAATTIGQLSSCTLDQQRSWATLAKRAFGADVRKWPRDTVGRIGSVLSGLSKEEIQSLSRQQLEAISPETIRTIPPVMFDAFTEDQLSSFDREQARQISGEQMEALSKRKRYLVMKLSTGVKETDKKENNGVIRIDQSIVQTTCLAAIVYIMTK